MTEKSMRRLAAIASMKRDIELARLSRSVQAHDALTTERDRLEARMQNARSQIPQSVHDARSAEAFCAFIRGRDQSLAQAQVAMSTTIAAQKDHAAKAFGRAETLAKLSRGRRRGYG